MVEATLADASPLNEDNQGVNEANMEIREMEEFNKNATM